MPRKTQNLHIILYIQDFYERNLIKNLPKRILWAQITSLWDSNTSSAGNISITSKLFQRTGKTHFSNEHSPLNTKWTVWDPSSHSQFLPLKSLRHCGRPHSPGQTTRSPSPGSCGAARLPEQAVHFPRCSDSKFWQTTESSSNRFPKETLSSTNLKGGSPRGQGQQLLACHRHAPAHTLPHWPGRPRVPTVRW